jgi:hypothetical protein
LHKFIQGYKESGRAFQEAAVWKLPRYCAHNVISRVSGV